MCTFSIVLKVEHTQKDTFNMMKSLLLIFLFGYSQMLLAQDDLLQREVDIAPGTYTPLELAQELGRQGITLSYATASLLSTQVRLSAKSQTVEELLPKIFKLSQYSYIQRGGKILIVPRNESSITISGFLEDAASQERLIGANVYLPQLGLGTATNAYGFYSLTVNAPADSLLLQAAYIGYSTQSYWLSGHQDHTLDVALPAADLQLQEVTVTDKNQRITSTQMGQVNLSVKEIKGVPAFFGEADVLKTIQLLPGVQTTSEGNINYIVRGGGPDQNLILLDGVPVYNASHLFGFFSVFNVDAIKNVSFTKGGFPARFGGRLSSVLEIDMKEGDMEKFHGAGSIGLLASKLTLEGPIVKNKASFMLSGRRTYFDLLLRPFMEDNQDAGYFFHDLNAKLNYKFSRKDRLYLSFYTGLDKLFEESTETHSSGFNSFTNRRKTNLTYGNRTGALRWNHLYSDKLFSNLTGTYTRYNLRIGQEYESQTSYDATEYFSRIEDYGLKYEADYAFRQNHQVKFGGSYTYHTFKPGAVQFEQRDARNNTDSLLKFSPTTVSNDAYLFLEDNWAINSRWLLNAGLHYSAYLVEASFYHSLQPRASARYLLNDEWSLKASYAYMQQYVHLLTNSGAGLPTDLWVSSTKRVAPQKSHQVAVGSVKSLWGGKYEFTSELYYKFMNDLIAFKEGALFTNSANWENQVETNGQGNSYGLELMLRKTKGRTTGWLAYTLARATRQFEEINSGQAFPYKYDRRHDIKLVLSHQFSKRFNVGLAFLLNSGIKATVPTSSFTDINGNQQTLYSTRNAYEYPAYHRADISFNWTKQKKWGERTWTLGLYNAYNRQNPYFIYFVTSKGEREAKQFSLFPVMPSFSYSFRF